MTEPAVATETPDVAETVSFLRRFAELMANGYNGVHLRRAADLLETLTARVISAADEEGLAQYKYETLTRHADALEAECDALRNDIEGHLEISLGAAGRARYARGNAAGERSGTCRASRGPGPERDERAAKSAAHEADARRTSHGVRSEA